MIGADLDISTFSIVGRSPDGKQIGVAVASRFLAVGGYVGAATLHGALATQALTNMRLRPEGLAMLENGIPAPEVLETFLASDPDKQRRQAGIVDANGYVATFTGADCKPWAGGQAEAHPNGSFAVQGNLLAGPEVIEAMVAAWCEADPEQDIAWRLLAALEAGDAVGGDIRGRQASALYVIEKDRGYGGTSDIYVDLRCDNSERPVQELRHLLELHAALFADEK